MPQATPFDAILVESRDLFRDRLCEAVGKMFDVADESLSGLAEKTKDEEMQKRLLDARDLATANREIIEGAFRTKFMSEFQKRTNQAKKIGVSLSDISLDDLQLVGEDDLNETLKFNDMAAKLRRYCEEELGALDQRVGVLMGDASLEAENNPFGPQVICDAYKHACKQVDCPVEIRMVFLKLFDDHVLDTVRSSYKEVNDLLVENSILPKIRYGISKKEDSGKAPGPGIPPLEKEKGEGGEAPPEDPFAQLAKMLAPGGAAGGAMAPGMGVGNIPMVQGAELLSSLSQLQVGNLAALGEAAAELGPILAEAGNLKNVLHQLKSTSVGGSMGQVDAMTLDIVAMLFDQLFDDPKIPIALKGLIGRLQLPMLKVAISDKDLFATKTHPARQLLDVLGQIGLRIPADFDSTSPLFPKLEAFIQELVDGFQEKMEIFDKVRGDLEALVAEHDQQVSKDMESSEKELEQQERLAVAKLAAQEEIGKRLESHWASPRPVLQYLAQEWIKYLTIVHARDGPKAGTWNAAVEYMDNLLWSVEPKSTPEDRRKLATTIPSLLKVGRTGITEGGIDPAVASAFQDELMKLHTEVMKPAPAAKKGKPGEPAKPAPAPKPDEDLMDFTQPVTINNPFGQGQVEVSTENLDFTAQPEAMIVAAPEPAPAAPGAPGAPAAPKRKESAKYAKVAIRLPTAMIMGAWVEVLAEDEKTKAYAKLHYVSPMKSHFLFVDRRGKKVFECSRSILARRIKLGQVTLLDGEPDASLFDRIMDGVFGKLRTTAVPQGA